MWDNTFYCILVANIAVLFTVIVFDLLHTESEFKQQAKQIGCEYLGRTSDVSNVLFFNCNGEVKLKLKSELNNV